MAKRLDVYGIGNALMDLQVQITEQEFDKLQLTKGAMQLVDVNTQEKLLQRFCTQPIHQASGGSAANSLIAIGQLGGQGSYACLVGQDRFGEFYLEEMSSLGISLHNAPIVGQPTGTCLILITPDAERTLNTALGATSLFAPEHVSEEQIESAEWLYIEGYLLSSERGTEAALRAAMAAKRCGTKVALTFSDTFIVNVFRNNLEQVLQYTDLAFANYHEALAFAQSTDEEQGFRALQDAVPNAIMTLSERGAWAHFAGETFFAEPFKVKPIDNTGAGDMFAGAFLYGITHGKSPQVAAKLACFLASRVVSQLGPRLIQNPLEIPEVRAILA